MTGPQTSPPAIFLEIDRAMRSGAMERAMELARRALDGGLSHPVLFSLRAYWHESEGRVPAALADLDQAQTLEPGNAKTFVSIGRCLTLLGRSEEALTHLAAATVLNPALPGAWYERGFAHENLGDLVEARRAYEEAVRLAPQMIDGIARLAALAARRSDWTAARALADRVLAADPHNAIALFAHITADLAAGDFAAAEHRARSAAEFPATVPQAKANAFSYLGDALHGQGRTAEAFAAYNQANAGLKQLFRERFEAPDVETGYPLAERLAAQIAATTSADWTAQEDVPQSPVFLIGFPRSGTTLLGQILAGHSRVVTLEEKPLLMEGIARFIDAPDGLAALASLSVADCAQYRALYWRRVQQELDKDITGLALVDQTPLNTLHLPLIAKLFPRARIVFALRDPRDVVLSCFRRLFVPNRYVYEFLSLTGTARFYDTTMRFADLCRERLPLQFHDVRNEDLVADFTGTVKSLCGFLGLEWDPALSKFAEKSRSRGIATPSSVQVARGLNADGIGLWRHYRNEMEEVVPILSPWAARFHYEP